MSLDRPTRSICPKQTERTSEDRLRDKLRSSNATSLTNNVKNMLYIISSLVREKIYFLTSHWTPKLLFGLIQLIGSTRSKFDV